MTENPGLSINEHRELFAKKLKELRLSRNLTKDGVAKEMGVSYRTALSRLELGQGTCNFDTLCRLAQVFDVHPGYFFTP